MVCSKFLLVSVLSYLALTLSVSVLAEDRNFCPKGVKVVSWKLFGFELNYKRIRIIPGLDSIIVETFSGEEYELTGDRGEIIRYTVSSLGNQDFCVQNSDDITVINVNYPE